MERTISYLIKPASFDCNMFCDYCFYRRTAESYPESDRHRMTPEVYETLAKKAQTYNPNAVGYLWQGGEPMLMGLDFYRAAIDIQNRHKRPGQAISNVIQTNGIGINEEWARFFADHNFLVGISIDGPKELHDIHRFTRTKESVFDRVRDGVNQLEKFGVEFNILTVVNNDTVHHPETVYRFLVEQGFSYLQFIPCVEVVDGETAPFSIDAGDYGQFLCDLFDLWFAEGYPYVSIRLFDNLLQYYVGQIPESCMFKDSCGWYLVVEHNGDVYPCDFFVLPEWKLGNVVDDTIPDILDRPLYNKFAHIRDLPCDDCDTCEWLDFCHRGCVKFRHFPTLDYSAKNYLCDSYRRFFEYSRDRYRFMAWDIIRRHRGIEVPQPGRNDPCPCGSGRKYKKCCAQYESIMHR